MDTDPQPPLPCPLINTALPQSNHPPFQLRVPQVELPKMVALGPISPLLSCPRGLSCCSTPSCSCATTPRAGKKNRELPQAAPSAAAPRTGIREEQQPHQRGAPGLRRPQPSAAHGGCRAAPRPALLVPSDATARGKKSRELPQAAPSAAAPRTRVREKQQPHQRGAPGLRRPQPSAAHGGSRAAPRPALLVPELHSYTGAVWPRSSDTARRITHFTLAAPLGQKLKVDDLAA